MYTAVFQRAFVVVVLTALGLPANAAAPRSARELAPVVLSTSVTSNRRLMTITGENFGHAAPTVTLAGRTVPVESHSVTEIVVHLPAAVKEGTYYLTVAAGGAANSQPTVFYPVIASPAETTAGISGE
jgi:hypothetical protein